MARARGANYVNRQAAKARRSARFIVPESVSLRRVVDGKHAGGWVVSWKTAAMQASAFTYFDGEESEIYARQFATWFAQNHVKAKVKGIGRPFKGFKDEDVRRRVDRNYMKAWGWSALHDAGVTFKGTLYQVMRALGKPVAYGERQRPIWMFSGCDGGALVVVLSHPKPEFLEDGERAPFTYWSDSLGLWGWLDRRLTAEGLAPLINFQG